MLLRKEQGGATIAGYEWANDGDVVEVPGALGLELVAIKGGGFTEVLPPSGPEEAQATESEPDDEPDTDTAADAVAEKPKRPYRRRAVASGDESTGDSE